MCLLVKVYHPSRNLAQTDDSSLTKPQDPATSMREIPSQRHICNMWNCTVQQKTFRLWETLQVKAWVLHK